MESFKRNVDDFIDFCYEKVESDGSISKVEMTTSKAFLDNFSREVMIDKFIKDVLPHHEQLYKREKPESVLKLIPNEKLIEIFDSSSEEDLEEFWDIVIELVRSVIVYIHQKREMVDGKYTKKYASEFSVKKLSELWNVSL